MWRCPRSGGQDTCVLLGRAQGHWWVSLPTKRHMAYVEASKGWRIEGLEDWGLDQKSEFVCTFPSGSSSQYFTTPLGQAHPTLIVIYIRSSFCFYSLNATNAHTIPRHESSLIPKPDGPIRTSTHFPPPPAHPALPHLHPLSPEFLANYPP